MEWRGPNPNSLAWGRFGLLPRAVMKVLLVKKQMITVARTAKLPPGIRRSWELRDEMVIEPPLDVLLVLGPMDDPKPRTPCVTVSSVAQDCSQPQVASQVHVSPHWQPERRSALAVWQPQVHVSPTQDPQTQSAELLII